MAEEYNSQFSGREIDERLQKAGAAICYTEQTLTEEQKEQARENIGVAGVHVGAEPPTDPNVILWIDMDDDPDSPGDGEASAQADWNAAEGEPGHILNRTHWSELVEVLPEQTVPLDEEGAGYVESSLVLVEGETYRVKLDGVVYDCVAWAYTEEGITVPVIGNKALLGLGDDTGESFIVLTMDGIVQFMTIEPKPECTLGISVMQYHKIPRQYLPNNNGYVVTVLKEDISNGAKNVAFKSLDTTELVEALLANRPVYLDLTDIQNGNEKKILVGTWFTLSGQLRDYPKESALIYLCAQDINVGGSTVFTLATNVGDD